MIDDKLHFRLWLMNESLIGSNQHVVLQPTFPMHVDVDGKEQIEYHRDYFPVQHKYLLSSPKTMNRIDLFIDNRDLYEHQGDVLHQSLHPCKVLPKDEFYHVEEEIELDRVILCC